MFFFFNDTATTEIYTLSLHDALPISWDLSDEDVHTALERRLREVVGDVALKLHTGRSRNDQVALDLHLFARDTAEEIEAGGLAAVRALGGGGGGKRDLLPPRHTHPHRAQPLPLSPPLLAPFAAPRR